MSTTEISTDAESGIEKADATTRSDTVPEDAEGTAAQPVPAPDQGAGVDGTEGDAAAKTVRLDQAARVAPDSSDSSDSSDDVTSGEAGTKPGAPEGRARFRLPTLPGSARARSLTARAAVALLLGAALCATVILFVQNKNKADLLAAHDDAQAAACKYAPVLATYDSKNLDAYFAAVLGGATGDWKTQFDSTSKDLRDVLTAGQVVSKVNDVQCAIRTGDTNSAEAIVVIGQTVTSVGTNNQPKPGQLSMVMRLQRTGGRWLVNKVDSPLAALNQR